MLFVYSLGSRGKCEHAIENPGFFLSFLLLLKKEEKKDLSFFIFPEKKAKFFFTYTRVDFFFPRRRIKLRASHCLNAYTFEIFIGWSQRNVISCACILFLHRCKTIFLWAFQHITYKNAFTSEKFLCKNLFVLSFPHLTRDEFFFVFSYCLSVVTAGVVLFFFFFETTYKQSIRRLY